ncbi:hypothetical protein C8D88_101988 [Lentzea atacamensis]|uniref:Uncharacterized protein n=1 Tax=Lentzea atacamensis TaxID=531938 RepID=A0A316IE50_9PSEU|nr:hypothetical protein [Lentzea atacamensis]PWK90960.1 hypothetical protein C8D88_101988 [Lentzea atacamensis]
MRQNVGLGWVRDALLVATWAGLALVGIVAVIAGFAVHEIQSNLDPELDDWPLRGSLADDEALLDRAEQAWRDFGGLDGDAHPLFAERSSELAANMVLVAMAGRTDDDRPVVAFVTSLATTGTPATDRLFVRAVSFPEERPLAVGFVAARQDPSEAVPDGGSLAFALAGPKNPVVSVRTNVIDPGRREPEPPGETFWRVLPRGAGAWNTTMSTGQSHEEPLRPAAGVRDPATTLAKVSTRDGAVAAEYRTPAAGDLVTSSTAMLGVVTDTSGRMETTPTAWTAWGSVSTEKSGVPGTLTAGSGGTLLFTATGPGEVADDDRLVFTSAANAGVVVEVGRLTKADGGWQVERGVNLSQYQLSTVAVTP